MSEGGSTIPSELLQPSEAVLQQEAKRPSGQVPDRWLQIEEIELRRINSQLDHALQERTKNMTTQELQQRQDTVKRYFGELMLPPSFENGPYAGRHWLNLGELLRRVVDIERDETLVPDVDLQVPFYSTAFRKAGIITGSIINKVQSSLEPKDRLTHAQTNDCFTNVSQLQLDALVTQIAQSGLTIFAESPEERKWRKAGISPQSIHKL